MNRTPNYSFEKPEGSDLLVPDPFNNNFDKIDTELYNLNEAIAGGGGGGGDSDPWELLTHGVHEVTNVRSGTYVDLDTGEEKSFSSTNYNYMSVLTPFIEDATKNIKDYGLLYLISRMNLTVVNSTSTESYFAILPGFANELSGVIQQGIDVSDSFLYAEPIYGNSTKTYDLYFKTPVFNIGYVRIEAQSTSSYRGVVNVKSPLAEHTSRVFFTIPVGLIPNKASDDSVAGTSGTSAYYNHVVQHVCHVFANTQTTGNSKSRTFGFRLMKGNDSAITFNGSIEYKLYGKHAYAGLSL